MVEIQERQVKILRNINNKDNEKNIKNKAEIEKKKMIKQNWGLPVTSTESTEYFSFPDSRIRE